MITVIITTIIAKRKHLVLLISLLILLLTVTSCGIFGFGSDLSSRDNLMKVYITVSYNNDYSQIYEVLKQYGLNDKNGWYKYREEMLKLAQNPEEYEQFKKDAVDNYIKGITGDTIIRYYPTQSFSRGFRPSKDRTKEISEEDFNTSETAYKAYIKIRPENKTLKLCILEFYKNGILDTKAYYSGKSGGKTIKEETFDSEGNITKVIYVNIDPEE